MIELDWMDKVKYDEKGLVPAIAQDAYSGTVLMLAYMNREALLQTINTKRVTYFSRSQQSLWVKGESSGNIQELQSLYYDCDYDAILLKVKQSGPACHTGEYSCFYRLGAGDANASLEGSQAILRDYAVIMERKEHPKEGSYTNYLFEKGIDKSCKKVGEEAAEVIIATMKKDKEELTYEAADMIYHLLVVMAQTGVTPEMVFAEMERRRK